MENARHIFSGTCTGRLVYLDTGCLVPADGRFSLRTICRQMNPPLPAKRKHRKNFRLAAYGKSFTRRPAQYGIFGHNDYDRKWAVLCYGNRYDIRKLGNRRYAFTRTAPQTPLTRRLNHTEKCLHPGLIICAIHFFWDLQKNHRFLICLYFLSLGVRSHSGKPACSCHHHAKPWRRAHGKTVCRYPTSSCVENTRQCFCYLF